MRIPLCHRDGTVSHQLCNRMERNALLDKPARKSVPERMKDHFLARIIHPGVEAEFFHTVPEGTGDLSAFLPCCSREEEAFLVLPRETPFKHRFDWLCQKGKAVLTVFGIANQDLAISKIDVPPHKVVNLPSPKPAVEGQQAFVMEIQRNGFYLDKQRIGFVFGEETKSSVVNLGPTHPSCRVFACNKFLSKSRIPEERDDRHGILRCPWSKSRLENRTHYGIDMGFFSVH